MRCKTRIPVERLASARLFILAACLLLLASMHRPAVASASGMDFWQRQRRGANGGAAEASDAWFQAAAEAGIEWVRLSPANMKGAGRDFLLGNADQFEGIPEEDMNQLREVLDRAGRHSIKVVLTMFSLPGARWKQQNNDQFDYRLWTQDRYHEQAAAFWKELAVRLARHPAVGGFNLLNEPHPERQHGFEAGETEGMEAWLAKIEGTAADLNLFYQRVIRSIREVDPLTPILVDCRFHAHPSGFRYWQPVPGDFVLYSFHFYDPWNYTTYRVNKDRFAYPEKMPEGWSGQTRAWTRADLEARMTAVKQWARQHQIPPHRIVVGEFGCDRRVEGAQPYLSDLVRIFNQEGWHWAFYSFRSADWDGMDYELGTEKLLPKYWQGREAGKAHEELIHRQNNPLWEILKSQFEPGKARP